AHTVAIKGRHYTSKFFLLATGSWPVVPDVPGSNHAITSNEAFFLEKRPERVTLVGGGYIAVEFAGIFHGMGSHVTLVHRGAKLLRGFDEDLRDVLGSEMSKRGIDLRLHCTVARIEKTSNGVCAHLDDGDMVSADVIMYATGRAPHTRGLGLEKAGVVMDGEGAIVVDSYSQSSVANIYAIGDCTNRIMLTPVAI